MNRTIQAPYEAVYPQELCDQEAEMIRARHAANGTPVAKIENRELIRGSMGLAFSGGGIRSATFCLGLVQGLAQLKTAQGGGLLKQFDFMSTVSGGGYFGAFFGALIQKGTKGGGGESGARSGIDQAIEHLRHSDSKPIQWLRENGYYLAPNGQADWWAIAAITLRNWLALHFVLLTFFLLPFVLVATLRQWLWANAPGYNHLEQHFIPPQPGAVGPSWWGSPLLLVGGLCLGLTLLLGFSFFLCQLIPNYQHRNHWQNWFTRAMAFGLAFTVGAVGIGLVDSAGIWIYQQLLQSHALSIFLKSLAGFYAGSMAAAAFLQRVRQKLAAFTNRKSTVFSGKILVGIAGFMWTILLLLCLAIAGNALLFLGDSADYSAVGKAANRADWLWLGLICLLLGVLDLILARFYGFVNMSSLAAFYSGRLRRAYLGAANSDRLESNTIVAVAHNKDDIPWDEYAPHLSGGPLHIVNTTLNETVSGKSQIEQRDRKGLSLAVGPAGISVGRLHHAQWMREDRRRILAVAPSEGFQIFPRTEAPLDMALRNGARWLRHPNGSNKPGPAPRPAVSRPVELLTLSQWIGISGAAFSTGTGMNTNLGLSLLCGLANVRLGYWWDSMIDAREHDGPQSPKLGETIARCFSWFFPAPSSLLNELFARFHGPARRHWYLSDGGHFENTACYELLRRRVRFIVCLDCGCDPEMAFEDVGNLVRKARIDFGAEIEFLTRADLSPGSAHAETLQQICGGLNVNFSLVGTPETFADASPRKDERKTGAFHSLLAKVSYDGNLTPQTYILFLKPSLDGDEPVDLLNYRIAHPEFPQQSTIDQFFGEDQWESYRCLGEHIAKVMFNPTEPAQLGEPAEPTEAFIRAVSVIRDSLFCIDPPK